MRVGGGGEWKRNIDFKLIGLVQPIALAAF